MLRKLKPNLTFNTSLGPVLKIFHFLGIWRRDTPLYKSMIFYFFQSYNIIFVINLCANLIINFEYKMFITFINYSAYYMSTMKVGSFARWHKDWESVVDSITEMEEEATENENSAHAIIVLKYRKYCHWVVYIFWVACGPIVIFMFVTYWLKDVKLSADFNEPMPHIFHAWTPFDQRTWFGRFVSALLQTIFGLSAPLHTCSWDSLVMSSMMFFAGQLKALRMRCAHALDEVDDDIRFKNLSKCHQHHINILR